MIRRSVGAFLVLAAVALAVPAAYAGPGQYEPSPCAQGAFTSFAGQALVQTPRWGEAVVVSMTGWIGPCPGKPLPSGYRIVPYYRDGVAVEFGENPDRFAFETEPTPFVRAGTYDADRDEGGPLLAVCLSYLRIVLLTCIAPDGFDAEGVPIFVSVPTAYVREHVSFWPVRFRLDPDPTCATCV